MTSEKDDEMEKEEMEKKEEMKRGKEKRKREDSLEEDIKKKKRIGPNARELEDEEPGAGPSTALTPTSNTRISISGFTFHQVLGEGRYGKVVLASVPGGIIFKAIKIIDKRDNAEALQRERRILLAARECPFLSHLCATQQSEEHAYFIMEHLSGGSLESLVRMCKRLNINSVRFYTAELICGLQFLHGHGIAHRDLKLANIMLDKDGHIRIIDLGVAKDSLTASSKIYGRTGTFRYMAPEVLLGEAYNVSVDWWSLGIVVSIMSSGRFPFNNGPEREKIYTSITSEKPKFPAWLGEDLTDLMMNLLQKDPERRLGVSGNIRDHPFFETICWEELEQRRTRPPFIPFPSSSGENHLD
ncbi:protein kinase C delta type-like [Ranitomeya variabilis]|uniref:protein kinase C delta type-like n=1 Tax=Ranitomeya variabilis TaxID=490064 RepID=UPI004057445A